jgi:hypothetical protein
MKKKRIACITYHKHPGKDWPQEEFVSHEVRLNSGETVNMQLAERGIYLSGKVWVREVRKLSKNGHQTSILSSNYIADLAPIAAAMFARWSQENFFAYMREHYGLDRVITYETEDIPDTTRVINPAWRRLDGEIRSKNMLLVRQLAEFGKIQLNEPIEPRYVEKYQQAKATIREEIMSLQKQLETLKIERKQQRKHIEASQLPKSDNFKRLQKDSKHFIDTIKMIAYRAETSMAYTIREKMSRIDDARALLRGIYTSDVDILPDTENKIVTIRIHHAANRCGDEIIKYLCEELNATETVFPGTEMKISYEMVS